MEMQNPPPAPESPKTFTCEKCGTKIGGRNIAGENDPAETGVFALRIVTNGDIGCQRTSDDFVSLFEFWDQRNKKARTICGACLASAVLSVPCPQCVPLV